ncbi:URC4/urg3 family protein [Alsobacter sp. SYSU BS001988]
MGAEAMDAALARTLLSPKAVRERAHRLLHLGVAGELPHFEVDSGKLCRCADYVTATIRRNYPTLQIPLHARWRHFAAGGFDRWGTLARDAAWPSSAAKGRAAFDLAIVSVLLDAGAGPRWRYREDASGESFSRSEGLAVASFDMFSAGLFSARPNEPLRADAARLAALEPAGVARAFQVGPENPMTGLDGRLALLARLGEVVAAAPGVFGRHDDPRPGGLFDHLCAQAEGGVLPAEAILRAILDHLGPIWPGRITLGGVNLGDTWRHPSLVTDDATSGLVPFHKLSQWLAYSLIEPLQDAGIGVSGMDALTGLAEYRNGGLFIDTGVLTLRDPALAETAHPVDAPLIVEWRALTIALLDDTAALVRSSLGLTAEQFPLAKALEGGAWAAGRRIARERRPDGSPPLQVVSDGTVF